MYSWVYTILCGLLLFNGLSLISRKVAVNFKYLGLFYILFAYQLFVTHFRVGGTMYLLPHFYKTGSLVGYLYGPIFYFFIIATVNGDFKLRLRDLVHFIPFSLHFLELLPFFLLSGEEKRILYSKDPQTYFMDVDWGYFSQRIHTIFKCILIITYSFVGYRLISPFLNNILNSDTTQSRLFGLFLKWSTRLLLVTSILILITYSLYWLFPLNFQLLGHYTFFVSAVFGALFLMLFPEITGWRILSFAKETVIEESDDNNLKQLKKSDYLSTQIYEAFTKILEEHYTDPELDIGKMAQLLFMSERTLYRKLKEIFGNSPNEVLLDFRLKRAYNAIQLEPNKTLGKIIKENGFLTNSYFARCFKKSYGILPSDFQRECRINNSSNKN
jgi:AraC-like DNA-binding protein